MVGAGRRIGEALGRGIVLAAVALGTTGCAGFLNGLPDPGSFHLPDKSTFFPNGISSYARPVSAEGPVGPADLVDGQGRCAGAAAVEASGASIGSKGVSLEMTECEVVRTLGAPQAAEIGGRPGGERTAVLTYMTGEHAGNYRFASGRLVSIERGAQPLPPPATTAKKPPPRKPKPQQTPG